MGDRESEQHSFLNPADRSTAYEDRQLYKADGLQIYTQATWVFVIRAIEMMALSAFYNRLLLDAGLYAYYGHHKAQTVFVLLFIANALFYLLHRYLLKHSYSTWLLRIVHLANVVLEGVMMPFLAHLLQVDMTYLSLGAFLMGVQNLQCMLHFSVFKRASLLSLLFSVGVYLSWMALETLHWKDPKWIKLHAVWLWYILYGLMLTHDLNRLVLIHMDHLDHVTALKSTQLHRYFH